MDVRYVLSACMGFARLAFMRFILKAHQINIAHTQTNEQQKHAKNHKSLASLDE